MIVYISDSMGVRDIYETDGEDAIATTEPLTVLVRSSLSIFNFREELKTHLSDTLSPFFSKSCLDCRIYELFIFFVVKSAFPVSSRSTRALQVQARF